MILVVLENQRGKIHPFSIEALVAGQKFAKNLAYSSAIKRLRKIIPGIGSGFGAWQGYKEMEILKISNSCINCDNLNHELKRCGIHEVEVSEKYTCAEFRTDSA